MYLSSQLLPISALQHLLFCERQAALIHLEGLWAENRFTAEGRLLHRKAHDPRKVSGDRRGGVRTVRGLEVARTVASTTKILVMMLTVASRWPVEPARAGNLSKPVRGGWACRSGGWACASKHR